MLYKNNPVYKSLKLLVKQAKIIQETCRFNRAEKDLAYLKEFCTVKVSTARRSGHSSALALFVAKKVSKGESVMVLSVVRSQLALNKRLVEGALGEMGTDVAKSTNSLIEVHKGSSAIFGDRSNVRSEHLGRPTYDCAKLRGNNLDYIIVDCASVWSKKEINGIYKNLGPSFNYTNHPIIIFLQ